MSLENPHIGEMLAHLMFPEIKKRASDALQEYRTAALAVAKLLLPIDAKEREVRRLQDNLHTKLFGLLQEDLQLLPRRETVVSSGHGARNGTAA